MCEDCLPSAHTHTHSYPDSPLQTHRLRVCNPIPIALLLGVCAVELVRIMAEQFVFYYSTGINNDRYYYYATLPSAIEMECEEKRAHLCVSPSNHQRSICRRIHNARTMKLEI